MKNLNAPLVPVYIRHRNTGRPSLLFSRPSNTETSRTQWTFCHGRHTYKLLAEGQNDKSVNGCEKAKAFFTQKLFLWVSYFACRFLFLEKSKIDRKIIIV
jgi:hypothetical protein